MTADTETPAAARQAPWRFGLNNRGSLRARLMAVFTADYHTSVIRRVIVLAVFIAPAFLANLLVYYFTARILNAESFGLFYVAVTIGGVAFSGASVLNIFFTRYLVQARTNSVIVTRRIQRLAGFWGGLLSLVLFAFLLPTSKYFGVQSPLVLLLIVIDTYLSYLADIGRAFLQSRRETLQLGSYTLAWMLARLLLCVLGGVLFGTVWAALLGSALAAALTFIGFQFLLMRAGYRDGAPTVELGPVPSFPALLSLLPVALGYGLLMIISNLDILLVYFLLSNQQIGIYSASSVFPKGILVLTMPISQMLFALMLDGQQSGGVFRVAVRKTLGTIFAATGAIALTIWLLSPWVCGGSYGLGLCDAAPLHVLLLSAVALSVLRITVLLEFVQQRDWLILSLILPAIAFLSYAWHSKPGVQELALQFTVFAIGTLIFFTMVRWAASQWHKTRSVA